MVPGVGVRCIVTQGQAVQAPGGSNERHWGGPGRVSGCSRWASPVSQLSLRSQAVVLLNHPAPLVVQLVQNLTELN